MAVFLAKDKEVILRHALNKLQSTTLVTAVGPGAIARSLVESITTELGDFYSIMDFNTSMGFISTAQGRALDMMGQLYNIERKSLTQLATIDKSIGAFYFYIDQPFGQNITIPIGTTVFTDSNTFIGEQFRYQTTEEVSIPIGRTRAFCGIVPQSLDSVFTAGKDTLTQHNFASPVGTTIRCTNPKPISPQVGFEADSEYRARIIKAVRTVGGGTEESIRFKALSIPGVRDIKVRQAPYGLASFEVLVVTEDTVTANAIVNEVGLALMPIRPVGCKMYIKEPELLPMDMSLTVSFKNVREVDKPNLSRRVQIAIIRHLNKLTVSENFVYNQLIQTILDSIETVSDVSFTSLRVSGNEILRRNYVPELDQQIVPGNISVSYT